MNRRFVLLLGVLLIVANCVAAADKSKSPKQPGYAGQRTINSALKHLADAQKLAKGTPEEVADAIVHLKKAETVLQKDKGNRHGSFKEAAHRLSGQAAKDLEKGLMDKAHHNIEEAIEAAHKAGKAKED